MLTTGKSFNINLFEIGAEGHDPLDPASALTPDPTSTSVASSVFGPEAIDSSFLSSQFCPEFVCRLEANEAVAAISSIGLLGTIVYSPTPGDPEIGTSFLFALGHFPLRVKTDAEDLELRITINF